ncbi:MAG TPA: neutral zinc metallopeptidase [Candidatus Limnocylindria bacterium]|nr:neutral zinc metallopeptidase [Candidatus Limnocylindria bacterium]
MALAAPAAVDAASAVDDDRSQRETQGRVAPQKRTHGSSARQQQWFRSGSRPATSGSATPASNAGSAS